MPGHLEAWRKRDPLALFRGYLLQHELVAPGDLDAVDARIEGAVQEAVAFADASPWPAFDERSGTLMFA